jgi:hypothetical protein
LKRAIQKHIAMYMSEAVERQLGRRNMATARNFALLYAAGCLAIKAGILPSTRQHLRQALRRPLIAAIAHLRRYYITDDMIRRILSRRLRSSAVIPVRRGLRFGPATQSGFWRQREGEVVFTIHAKAFRRWFGDAAECRAALRWLHRSGRLLLRNRHAIPCSKSTEWAERTPRWPDGTVQRSFVFKASNSFRRHFHNSIVSADDDSAVSEEPLEPPSLFEGLPPPPQGYTPRKRPARPVDVKRGAHPDVAGQDIGPGYARLNVVPPHRSPMTTS